MAKLLDRLFKKDPAQSAGSSPESQSGSRLLPQTNEQQESLVFSRRDTQSWEYGCCQSVGRVREHNEDSIFAFSSSIPIAGRLVPIGLFIVADGMGGHQSGEIASNLAVRSVAYQILSKIFLLLLKTAHFLHESNLPEILTESVISTNKLIGEKAPGSGTTFSSILLLEEQLFITHVGDSRVYTVSQNGDFNQLTRDHSLVNRMIELGHLSESEAANHPQRNVLYKALGQGEPLSPDTSQMAMPDDGYLLLCSDGLWGVIPHSEMAKIIRENSSPAKACQLLVDTANSAGGPDNISAILIKLK